MNRAPLLLLAFASFLLLLPGCLSESIKTGDECASLAPPSSGPNWAGQDISEYGDAWAYEQVNCWHEAAIWYAIKGETYNAAVSCSNIRDVRWDYPSWLDDEYNICISDISEKLADPLLCNQIQNIDTNRYIRGRCISRAEKAAGIENREFCSAAFILAGMGAFLFISPKIKR